MGMDILPAIERAIAALTYDEIECHDVDVAGRPIITVGEAIPLLRRSIGQDLVRIDRMLSQRASLLSAIAVSIDEALLALEEARLMLAGGAQ